MCENDKKNIILTGFMGTGKTTVGKKLAQKLGYQFVDTDHLIEDKIGMTIAEYFKVEGEDAFRKQESLLAHELAKRQRHVISTGGRFMLDPGNAEVLAKTGSVFCLVASPEEILARVKQDGETRPLLQDDNPLEKIIELLEQRKEGYGQFTQVFTSDKDPDTIVADLASLHTGA